MISIPYVKGVSETLARAYRHHGISAAMKPLLTLKCMLVYRKDKRTPHDTAGVVYQIPCKDCPKVYTGKTVRKYGIREKEHHKDVDSVREKKYTRARRKDSVKEYHPSALMDHLAQFNHTIDWEGVKRPMAESHWKARGIKEAVQIRKTGPHVMNRDRGCHQLPDVYTRLLTAVPPSGTTQQ